MAEAPFDFLPPGGQFQNLVGLPVGTLSTADFTPTKMIHHVVSTFAFTTIVKPHEGYAGPLYLIADSLFTWTSAGNIIAGNATTLIANHAYGFIYDRFTAKWYPLETI